MNPPLSCCETSQLQHLLRKVLRYPVLCGEFDTSWSLLGQRSALGSCILNSSLRGGFFCTLSTPLYSISALRKHMPSGNCKTKHALHHRLNIFSHRPCLLIHKTTFFQQGVPTHTHFLSLFFFSLSLSGAT